MSTWRGWQRKVRTPDRYQVGTTIDGPAVIEERESTCVLGPGDRATVDPHLNLVAELANEESDS